MDNTKLDPLKLWLLEQLKAEETKGQTPRFWRLKDWSARVGMAEFESTRLSWTLTTLEPPKVKKQIYDELTQSIKDEIKFLEK